MRHFISLIVISLLLVNNSVAQGVFGKKAVIKANVLNGFRLPFNDLQFEYAVGKKVSLTAGFSALPVKIRPEYRLAYAYHFLNIANESTLSNLGYSPSEIALIIANGQDVSSSSYSSSDGVVFGSNNRLTVSSAVWSLGIRKYRNPVFSAPYGKYYSFEVFRGKQKVSGLVQLPIPQVDQFYGSNNYVIRDVKNYKLEDQEINTTSFQFNVGKQWIKFDFLTIDLSWGLSYSITNSSNGLLGRYVSSVIAKNNGANFGAVPFPQWDSYTTGSQFRTNSLGMNLFLRVGCLIF
jgi:hypothetical protein